MSGIDQERERLRLTGEYSRMLDGELEVIAEDFASLTSAAQSAVTSELSRRGLAAQSTSSSDSKSSSDLLDNNEQRVIRRFVAVPEATIAQSKLAASGIDSFIADEYVLGPNPVLSPVLGGVRLFVNKSDAEDADEILGEPIPAEFEVEGIGRYIQPRCPECFSLEISYGQVDRTAMDLGVPLPLGKARWKCDACGCRWEDTEDESRDVSP